MWAVQPWFEFELQRLHQCIPDICRYFYTDNKFWSKILHLKTPENTPKYLIIPLKMLNIHFLRSIWKKKKITRMLSVASMTNIKYAPVSVLMSVHRTIISTRSMSKRMRMILTMLATGPRYLRSIEGETLRRRWEPSGRSGKRWKPAPLWSAALLSPGHVSDRD